MKKKNNKDKYNQKIEYILDKISKKILQIKSNKIIILGKKIIIYHKNIYINKLFSITSLKSKYYFLNKISKKKYTNLPIHLIIIKKKNNDFFNINIFIKKNSYLNIIEEYINISNNNYFNYNLYISIGKNSYLHYLKLINDKKKNKFYLKDNIKLNSKSKLKKKIFFIKFKKINLISNIKLKKKTTYNIKSISIIKKNFLKFNINILHHLYNTKSYQKHNNISLEPGIANFLGWIKIFKKSYNSQAIIKNNNLCICKKSIINSSPKLGIWNKNTKCKHNVKINNLNKEEIFYLLTRNIKFNKIKKILILKFINEIFKKKNYKNIYNKIYLCILKNI